MNTRLVLNLKKTGANSMTKLTETGSGAYEAEGTRTQPTSLNSVLGVGSSSTLSRTGVYKFKAEEMKLPKVLKINPSKELSHWLDERGYACVRNMSQNFENILFVPVHQEVISAALPFWNPDANEFVFGCYHLCPTIEEIAAITGLSMNGKVVILDKHANDKTQLAEFLGIDKSKFPLGYKELYANHARPIPKAGTMEYGYWIRKYLVCYFGEILFGRSNLTVDPMVIRAVKKFWEGENVVPIILGELLRHLDNPTKFRGSPFLLYLWIREHLPIRELDEVFEEVRSFPTTSNELINFYATEEDAIQWPKDISSASLITDWEALYQTNIRWESGWIKFMNRSDFLILQKNVSGEITDMMLLPSFDDPVIYQPSRHVRQFGCIQDAPLGGNFEEVITVSQLEERWKTTRACSRKLNLEKFKNIEDSITDEYMDYMIQGLPPSKEWPSAVDNHPDMDPRSEYLPMIEQGLKSQAKIMQLERTLKWLKDVNQLTDKTLAEMNKRMRTKSNPEEEDKLEAEFKMAQKRLTRYESIHNEKYRK